MVLGLNSLVSLRERLDPSVGVDVCGPYVSFTATFHPVGGKHDFWSLARGIRSSIQKQLQDGYPLLLLPQIARRVRRRRLHLDSDLKKTRDLFGRIERWLDAT